jgi:hypothetical protein
MVRGQLYGLNLLMIQVSVTGERDTIILMEQLGVLYQRKELIVQEQHGLHTPQPVLVK